MKARDKQPVDFSSPILKSKKSKRAVLICMLARSLLPPLFTLYVASDPITTQYYFSLSLTFSHTGNSSEACLSIVHLPFCINTQTGDTRDADGTTGNAITGNYVLADGQEGNLYHGPFPTPKTGSTIPEATATRGGTGIIATTARGILDETESATAADVNEQVATDAPTATNIPNTSITDGSGARTGGSGVNTGGEIVPGGAGRAGLGMGIGMWIMVTMLGASVFGAFLL